MMREFVRSLAHASVVFSFLFKFILKLVLSFFVVGGYRALSGKEGHTTHRHHNFVLECKYLTLILVSFFGRGCSDFTE